MPRLLKPHEIADDLERRTDWSVARGYTPEQRGAVIARIRAKYAAPAPTAPHSPPSATPLPTFLDPSALPLIDDGSRPKTPAQIAEARSKMNPHELLHDYINPKS